MPCGTKTLSPWFSGLPQGKLGDPQMTFASVPPGALRFCPKMTAMPSQQYPPRESSFLHCLRVHLVMQSFTDAVKNAIAAKMNIDPDTEESKRSVFNLINCC